MIETKYDGCLILDGEYDCTRCQRIKKPATNDELRDYCKQEFMLKMVETRNGFEATQLKVRSWLCG